VTRVVLYAVAFVIIQIAICAQLYRVIRAGLRTDDRAWYQFAVLALLAAAEGVVLLGVYRLTW
jgi:hypothetical protein